jgi:NDP-sugar pyrophosphorylase family protein
MTPAVFRCIPPATYYGMDSLIKDLIARGERVTRYLIHEYWLDIGQVDDYSVARNEYKQNFEGQ